MDTASAPNRRLIAWLIGMALFTFVVLLHLSFPNIGGSGLQMPFNATVWMGFVLMTAIALWPAAHGVIRYSPFHQGLGLLLLAFWLPFAWSWNEASLMALPRMLTVTAGALLLLGLAQPGLTRRDWWWIGMAILAGALLETAYALGQYYFLGPGLWINYDPEYGRPFGIFQQPNPLASFLVTGLAVSVWLMREARGWPGLAITGLAPLFIPLAVLLTYSRTGWLAFVIVVPLLLAYLLLTSRRHFLLWGGLLAAGCLLAAIGWMTIEAEDVARSGTSLGTPGIRLGIYAHGIDMILQKPFTGWGYGRFQHDFIHSLAEARAADPAVDLVITTNMAHPHNELLQWGIEGGLLPVLAMLGLGGYVAWRILTSGLGAERLLLVCLPLPLLLHSMTELPFYHSIAHFLAFLLLLGFVVSRTETFRERDFRYTFSIRIGAFLATPLLLLFFATHLHTLFKVADHVYGITSKPEPLAAIINPFGMYRQLEFIQMSRQVDAAAAIGFDGPIVEYAQWAEERKALIPRPELYYNLRLAYRALGDADAIERVEAEAEWLYPSFQAMYEKKPPSDTVEMMPPGLSDISR
ncbi:PglL family O-oligosaccharyltransferase [Halomonas lysinitropha]|uniref:O-Antigen ligase n=1 Tax=Halomonas lysinitropha TaxID=2607506 RepID=A0A5K1I844_9GAMM|nr:Wzy polymerase domain-containing protein [Halomonas lysinitropha]VVZ96661.1 O-Antigen ligase [Halomonas lysinitropha]